MPTYDYKREDGTTFEIVQRITAPSLTVCPTTGQKVKRIISTGAGLVFKGSGFYQTDYVRKPTSESASTAPSGSSDSKPKSKPSDSASTSKSEPSSSPKKSE